MRDAPGVAAAHDEISATLRVLLPRIRSWVWRYSGPDVETDDVTQLVLIELATALQRFRGESSLETYARRIAMRVASRARTVTRERNALQKNRDLDDVPDARNPESIAIDRNELARFYEKLAKLSEKRRNAFVLCAIEKLSHEEAALIEEIPVETLRARLKHARADLSNMIEKERQR